jgi:hypothetical protein
MQVTESLSWDSVDQSDQDAAYSSVPLEVLNNLNPSSFPPHRLLLKKGAPIILLRNVCAARGLANGTRLIVQNFTNRVIPGHYRVGQSCRHHCLAPPN